MYLNIWSYFQFNSIIYYIKIIYNKYLCFYMHVFFIFILFICLIILCVYNYVISNW